MATYEIDGALLQNMLLYGANNLAANKKTVNELNVFPVPDGDTGTNMEFTILGALNGARSASGGLGNVAKSMAKGALLGARGNSGVILSQFLKGLSVGFTDLETADVNAMGAAFRFGVDYAYKSVLQPTEGTMLTVLRESVCFAEQNINENSSVESFLGDFLQEAEQSLKRTPDLLPVLKKAGVVDSGAAGLICIVKGFLSCACGEELTDRLGCGLPGGEAISADKSEGEVHVGSFGADSVLEYGYCTEFILQLMNAKVEIPSFKLSTVTDYLQTIGDSIVAIQDEDVVKIHVHTKTPAKAIAFCQQYGEFVTFKMENMSVQHSETAFAEAAAADTAAIEAAAEYKPIAVAAVSDGEGLSQTFLSMGVDRIISGGQTMNPSSEDFINAFNTLNADDILVLPNNSNVYLAAKQAAELYTGARVHVVNTSSVAEGYAALTMLDTSSGDVYAIMEDLERAAANVYSLSVTNAVRSGEMDGVSFTQGEYICVAGKIMLSSSPDIVEAAVLGLTNAEGVKDREILTLIYGSSVTEEEKKCLISRINAQFSYLEVYEIYGGQDIYPFIIALE